MPTLKYFADFRLRAPYRPLLVALLAAIAPIVSTLRANTFLLDERFTDTPTVTSGSREIPDGWTLTTAGVSLGVTNVGVVDQTDPVFGGRLLTETAAVLLEDRENTSYPVVRAPWDTGAVSGSFLQGWFRIRFIPLEDSPGGSDFTTPRFLFRLRGSSDTNVVHFQSNGTRLYYYDESSGSPVGYRFAQSVVPNEINELLVWFDLNSRTIRGELNGVTLTRHDGMAVSLLKTTLLQGGETLENFEFRPGDGASYQEGILLTRFEVGQGAGPADRHAMTHGYVDVTIEARDIGGRASDSAPAAVELDFQRALRMAGFYRQRIKFSSVTVRESGSSTDLPARWYDDETPRDFPSVMVALSYNDDEAMADPPELDLELGNNLGPIYPVFGYSGTGLLTWLHTQTGTADTTYRISFETEDETTADGDPGPVGRGWVGDGTPRFDTNPTTTNGSVHMRVAVTDWDGDGDNDIVFGEAGGLLFLMRNVSEPTVSVPEPLAEFNRIEFVKDELGDPISVGIVAAPAIVDWDGDGVEDLLVGTHWNRVAYFRNVGTNSLRKFRFSGLVTVDGNPIETPWLPPSGDTNDVYTRSHYPTIEATDWDGDGHVDLLLGGYVTGRIFFYRNTNTTGQYSPLTPTAGIPVLEAPYTSVPDLMTPAPYGAITLKDNTGAMRLLNNVGDWSASPTTMRLDTADDIPDVLVTGLHPLLGQTGLDAPFVRLFFNVAGTNQPADMREIPIADYDPSTSPYFAGTAMPPPRLSAPRLADMNHDGLPDLVVGSVFNVYIFYNVGTSTAPAWAVHDTPVTSFYYGNVRLNGVSPVQLLDLNGDGLPDIFEGGFFSLMKSRTTFPNPFAHETRTSVFAQPVTAHIPAGPNNLIANSMAKLLDLDADGKLDYLFGDPLGQIWFHRNIDTASVPPYEFESSGVRCRRVGGAIIDVDLSVGTDFDQQDAGARPVYTIADFNADGDPDLVLGDTFGNVRYFAGAGLNGGVPEFQNEIFIGDIEFPNTARGGRLLQMDATDWDGDGDLDVVVSGAQVNSLKVFLNNGAGAFTALTTQPSIPTITSPASIMVDLDGDGGGEDLFINSIQGSVWFERSFLEDGYPTVDSVGSVVPTN